MKMAYLAIDKSKAFPIVKIHNFEIAQGPLHFGSQLL